MAYWKAIGKSNQFQVGDILKMGAQCWKIVAIGNETIRIGSPSQTEFELHVLPCNARGDLLGSLIFTVGVKPIIYNPVLLDSRQHLDRCWNL